MVFGLNIRAFNQAKDYADVSAWWKGHNWPVIPLKALSSRGFIAEDRGAKIAAVWLYTTDSVLGWLEFMVSNPLAPLKSRPGAVKNLVSVALEEARIIGLESVFTSLQTKSLKRLYSGLGFVESESGMTNYIARVQ